jgi:hypothetical protein
MPSFQSQFTESKGKPIIHQGKSLFMMDQFPTEHSTHLRIYFETCNGEWRQGVALSVDGTFEVNGRVIGKDQRLVLWHDTAPQIVELGVPTSANMVEVHNVWDSGDGMTDAWRNGAAMIIEEVPNGRRYRCNDGLADDDFDDIVFRIERI